MLKYREAAAKAERVQRRTDQRVKREMEAKARLDQARQAGFQEGFRAGVDQGTKDATTAVRAQAFSDLSNVWGQTAMGFKAAAQYAEILASMYQSRTNIRKDADANENRSKAAA